MALQPLIKKIICRTFEFLLLWLDIKLMKNKKPSYSAG